MAFPQARVTLLPIPMNSTPLTGVFPPASTPGYDAGSPSAITAWPNVSGAIRIPNNGQVYVFWASGATLPGVTQVLVGDPIGNTGTYAPGTTEQQTLAATSSGWLGPWSPATYNCQSAGVVFTGGALNSQATVAADVGCVLIDITTTTTLVMRAYTLIPVQP
jgi:hypothetical protein